MLKRDFFGTVGDRFAVVVAWKLKITKSSYYYWWHNQNEKFRRSQKYWLLQIIKSLELRTNSTIKYLILISRIFFTINQQKHSRKYQQKNEQDVNAYCLLRQVGKIYSTKEANFYACFVPFFDVEYF